MLGKESAVLIEQDWLHTFALEVRNQRLAGLQVWDPVRNCSAVVRYDSDGNLVIMTGMNERYPISLKDAAQDYLELKAKTPPFIAG